MAVDASAFGTTFSESQQFSSVLAMQQAHPPLFCQSPPLADWPNKVSRVLATSPHTHTCTYLCMSVRVCIALSVCFLYSLLATHICVAWRVEFSVVCKYTKCLFVGGVRMYVCTWRLWRNKCPLLPQHQNLQHQQKAKFPHCACLEHSTGWQTTTKYGKTIKTYSANKPVAVSVCFISY